MTTNSSEREREKFKGCDEKIINLDVAAIKGKVSLAYMA
jgi:hypothetical protein